MAARGIFSIVAIKVYGDFDAQFQSPLSKKRLEFKSSVAFRIHTYIPLLGSGGTTRRWKCLAHGVARAVYLFPLL